MKVNHLNAWYKPWFFKHVESYLKKGSGTKGHKHIEYIPIRDYYHRHQRSYFWEVEVGFGYGNNFLFRYLFGWVYPINFQIFKITSPKIAKTIFWEKNHILQDYMVPMNKLETIINFTHNEVEVCHHKIPYHHIAIDKSNFKIKLNCTFCISIDLSIMALPLQVF